MPFIIRRERARRRRETSEVTDLASGRPYSPSQRVPPACRELDEARRPSPTRGADDSCLGRLYRRSRTKERTALANSGRRVFPTAFRAYALARAGRVKEAEAALALIKAQQRTMFVPSYHTALVLNGLNRRDETLTELNRAVEGRDVSVTFLGVDPKWDNLRVVPAFQAIVARANLLDVSNRIAAPAR